MVEKCYISVDQLNLNMHNEPNYYNIIILPDELKKLVAKKLKGHFAWIKEQPPFNKEDEDTLIKRKYYIGK